MSLSNTVSTQGASGGAQTSKGNFTLRWLLLSLDAGSLKCCMKISVGEARVEITERFPEKEIMNVSET